MSCVPSSSRDWLETLIPFLSPNDIRLHIDSGQCLSTGLLSRGSDSGNEVNRKGSIEGEDSSQLSDSSVVSRAAVEAVFVPVL